METERELMSQISSSLLKQELHISTGKIEDGSNENKGILYIHLYVFVYLYAGTVNLAPYILLFLSHFKQDFLLTDLTRST